MIVDLLLITISLVMSSYAIIYIISHQENIATRLYGILLILVFLIVGLVYFPLFIFSTNTCFEQEISLTIFRYSMIVKIFSMGILISIHSFVIEYKRIKSLSGFMFAFLGGIIVSIIFFPNTFKVVEVGPYYKFIILNSYLLIFNIIYDLILIVLMCLMQIKSYFTIQNKKLGKLLTIQTFCFASVLITYSYYIFTQSILFRYLHLIFYLFSAGTLLYTVVRRPELLIELNKIYNFIIFHRSGILLYNYDFESNRELDETLLKGSILIGINHILSNFIDKKDQLNLIKIHDLDIVLEYDNTLNYAILLIVDKKDYFIERAVQRFMDKFSKIHVENLRNLNGLIDTSVFKNADVIIKEFFSPFIRK